MAVAQRTGLDWIDRIFGYAEDRTFAPAVIEVGDDITDADGICWRVDAKAACPYQVAPSAFAEYGTAGTWLFVWRMTPARGRVLSDWLPEQYVIDLIEKGQ